MYTLQVRRRTLGVADPHGNQSEVLGAAEDWPVWWIAPGPVLEDLVARDSSVVEWSVGAPKSDDVPGEKDVVVFQGVEYPVNGRPKDWTLGPFPNPVAGVVVELRRVEG